MSTDLRNLSISELKNVKRDSQHKLKKEYSKYKKKQKLIADIKKIQRVREKLEPKPIKSKSFDDYFQECIKNKTIPPDTPSYFRKALERALKEYDQGILKEKSALEEFANNMLSKENLVLLHFNFLNLKLRSSKTSYEIIEILKLGWF